MKALVLTTLSIMFLGVVAIASETISFGNAGATIFCNPNTKLAYEIEADRCRYRDEVMVGISSLQPLKIRCARLDVYCYQMGETAKPSTVEE